MMDKPAPSVRKSPVPTDRRAVRTRLALGNALVQLMLERDFADISVQQVLDRAGVARATFYTHYRNKHDLLLSDAERFMEMLESYFLRRYADTPRVAPVAELFAHVLEFDAFQRALASAGLREIVYDLVSGHVARLIERRIAVLHPRRTSGLSDALTARVFAGALVELLRWWLERSDRPSANEMDARFHEIVWHGLGGGERALKKS
jgi:AcrR family transcriptional regulator